MKEAGSARAMWLALLEETREALAALRLEELEELAERARGAFERVHGDGDGLPMAARDMREIAAQHRLLGEVLEATSANLAVLRRVRGLQGEGQGGSPWDR